MKVGFDAEWGGGLKGRAVSEAGLQEGFLEKETPEQERRGEGAPGWAWPESGCRGGQAGGLCKEQKQHGKAGNRHTHAHLSLCSPPRVRATVLFLHMRTPEAQVSQ